MCADTKGLDVVGAVLTFRDESYAGGRALRSAVILILLVKHAHFSKIALLNVADFAANLEDDWCGADSSS